MKSIFIFLIFSSQAATYDELAHIRSGLKIGAEHTKNYVPKLKGKRVGIVANQASVIGKTHLVDSLLNLGINIKTVFSPEHGFRGDADAGEHVHSNIDSLTGLPIISLYGDNKKPRPEQLEGIDIIVFDIQDVGVRFYTFISTLHYVMQACAENGVKLIILDRPNPNGHYIDGPVLDTNFRSFVGMHPVPIVHGMTIGEYALMINGEEWLGDSLKCSLSVVRCSKYSHYDSYSLPIAPSPNLRSDLAIQLYPSLCLLEATTVSVGRGTEGPFERFGHPLFPETGFTFVPISSLGSKNPKYQDVKCNGYNLRDSLPNFRANKLDLNYLLTAYQHLKDSSVFVDQWGFFNRLAGNNVLIQQISAGMTEKQIRDSWQEGLIRYKEMREEYLLYP